MFSFEELDAFSVAAWNTAFRPVSDWLPERNRVLSGMVPLVLVAALAAVTLPVVAHAANPSIAARQAQAPPVPTQQATKALTLPIIEGAPPVHAVTGIPDLMSEPAFSATGLNTKLKRLRDSHHSLADIVSIDPKTLRIARIISHQIPTSVSPSIGFDDRGNVFLHFKAAHVDAYLTVEQRSLHLFCRVEGARNIYIDNEPLSGKRLPTNIRVTLSKLLIT